jgi:hypothetical protein
MTGRSLTSPTDKTLNPPLRMRSYTEAGIGIKTTEPFA